MYCEKNAHCQAPKITTDSSGQSSQQSQRSGAASDIEARVNHPAHYTAHPSGIEAIQLTAFENFCIGNCLKYLLRRKHKGDELGDLLKAQWYLNKEIQLVRDGLLVDGGGD